MKLTKEKAKKDMIFIWKYLRDHPEIKRKEDLPDAKLNSKGC